MSKKSNDKLETMDTETHNKSVITIPIEKIAKRFIVPHDTYWVSLEDLNGFIIGNYLSMFFLGLGATLFAITSIHRYNNRVHQEVTKCKLKMRF